MVGKFKSFAAFGSERPGDIPRGVLSSRQKAVLVTLKSGDGQPEKPRCDIRQILTPESGTTLSGPMSVAG